MRRPSRNPASSQLSILKAILGTSYIGLGTITPARKPAHGELTDTDKRNNTAINRVRYLIERVISNLKTWRVLHADYRRPYNTFETTIQAVTRLIFAYTS